MYLDIDVCVHKCHEIQHKYADTDLLYKFLNIFYFYLKKYLRNIEFSSSTANPTILV